MASQDRRSASSAKATQPVHPPPLPQPLPPPPPAAVCSSQWDYSCDTEARPVCRRAGSARASNRPPLGRSRAAALASKPGRGG